MTYIHYGHTELHPEWLTGVKNRSPFGDVKPDPKTAIWASPKDAKHGWKDWCEEEQFKTGLSTNISRLSFPTRLRFY